MPLVIPGIQSEGGDDIQAWTTKLMGKTLGDDHSETVCAFPTYPFLPLHPVTCEFASDQGAFTNSLYPACSASQSKTSPRSTAFSSPIPCALKTTNPID